MRIQGKNLRKFWKSETPSGSINGSNASFTLSETPLEADTVLVFLNGLLKEPGTEYTISGKNLTLTVAPAPGQSLRVQYVQNTGGE